MISIPFGTSRLREKQRNESDSWIGDFVEDALIAHLFPGPPLPAPARLPLEPIPESTTGAGAAVGGTGDLMFDLAYL